MSYNPQNYTRVKELFARRRSDAQAQAEARRAEVWQKIPALAQIDAQLAQSAPLVMRAALQKEDVAETIEAIKEKNRALQAQRAELLLQNGYPADYTDLHHTCSLCSDYGSVGTKMCTCMKKELILCAYETSGLGTLLKTQSFDRFDLSYYQNDPQALRAAELALKKSMEYASSFSADTKENLLFFGKTGLGKTHLSTSIAKTVIDRGFDVVYETAQDLFYAMQQEQFQRDSAAAARVRCYFSCDLLILDDLGTELSNQFTVGCLYNLLNTRLNQGKPMILNTNLSQAEIFDRYSDRITSRIFGTFHPLPFLGTDIRAQKLREAYPS